MRNTLVKNLGTTLKVAVAACIVMIISYVVYQAIHLKLWSGNAQTGIKELSKKEKIEDFEYLTRYVKDIYPYSDAIVQYKRLDDLRSLEKEYIDRAGETSNNTEFFQLVYEYSQRLRQGDGHIGVYFGTNRPSNNNYVHYYFNDIPKSTYYKTDYWGQEAAKFQWYAFSDADVVYKDGKYILNEEYAFPDLTLPAGTIIVGIDGMQTDEYVNTLQNKTRLQVDADLNKNFVTTLFSIRPSTGFDYWTVDFQTKDGEVFTRKVKALNAAEDAGNGLASFQYPNMVCKEIDEDTGYIKIFTFDRQSIREDNQIIQDFMQASHGKYKKLILDVRGNTGGELEYWGENIIRPLLKESKSFVQYSAIRKKFFEQMGIRYPIYRRVMKNDLLQKDLYHIDKVEKTVLPGFSEQDWDIFKITKTFTPHNSFPFNGKVYILTDRDTFSAADSFAVAAKRTQLGQVVGTYTGGSGSAFIAPVDIALPHSQMMLRMNVELTLDEEVQPNQILGTAPDVALQASTFPTTNPNSLEVHDLVQDPWIDWVIHH
ncbi:S41 family peptidase [Gorillibacterium sp. CAU 1737]|uniref:S41 family peptidase n=1 Tax=Gorillibacterium sp. CAU 1737 TaxID=3140362 RepID=UPI0032612D8B